MAVVYTDDQHYKDIAEAVRVGAESTRKYKPSKMAAGVQYAIEHQKEIGKTEGYNEGYDDGVASGIEEGTAIGKQAEYDRFWDVFQQNGNRIDYSCGFGGHGWTDETFKPKYDIKPTGNCHKLFDSTQIGDLEAILAEQGVKIDLSLVQSGKRINQMFNYNGSMTAIPTIDVSACAQSNLDSMFAYNGSLKTIRLLKLREDGTNILLNAFASCVALENITIDGVIGNDINLQWSTKLTAESLYSIVSHLADLSDDDKYGTVGITLTDDQWSTLNTAYAPPAEDDWQTYIMLRGWMT